MEIDALMAMGHDAPGYSPDIFDGIGFRIVGWRVDDMQLAFVVGQQLANQQGARRGVGTCVVGQDNGYAATGLRASDGSAELFAEGCGSPLWRDLAIEPAVSPIGKAKTMHLLVVARGLDPPLAVAAFSAPDAGQRRMQVELDLILQIEIGPGQKAQEVTDIRRHLIQQVGCNQLLNGRRLRRCGRLQQSLHP